MANRTLTKGQQSELLKNPNILSCSDKYITFTDDFKLKSVLKYQEEHIPPRMIFMEAGFDIDVIGVDTPHNSLMRWRKQYRSGIKPKKKGRRKSSDDLSKMTLEEQNAYLRAKLDYVQSLHDFLVESRTRK